MKCKWNFLWTITDFIIDWTPEIYTAVVMFAMWLSLVYSGWLLGIAVVVLGSIIAGPFFRLLLRIDNKYWNRYVFERKARRYR